jgi:hypothetical protein
MAMQPGQGIKQRVPASSCLPVCSADNRRRISPEFDVRDAPNQFHRLGAKTNGRRWSLILHGIHICELGLNSVESRELNWLIMSSGWRDNGREALKFLLRLFLVLDLWIYHYHMNQAKDDPLRMEAPSVVVFISAALVLLLFILFEGVASD